MSKVEELKTQLNDVLRLGQAGAILGWDQQVNMPPGGGPARAEQLATLGKLSHQMFVTDEMGKLIEEAEAEVADADYDSDDAALVRVVRHDYDLATRVPTKLVEEIARTQGLAHEAWAKAREANDFPSFVPTLEKIFDLMRQQADALGYEDRPYDALLDQYEPYMKTADVERLFTDLRNDLVPFVAEIFENLDKVDDSLIHLNYDVKKQAEFGEMVIKRLGYDLTTNGRQDESLHPFTTSFSVNDVRITTRFQEDYMPTALFGSIHEAGHGMYEQGSDQSLDGTWLAGGTSLGVHESQSRLWENVVGRSRAFWGVFYPDLQKLFPDQLGRVAMDDWYKAVNSVSHSLIRVEADEVTYNLHIMLRFELENALLEEKVAVKDLRDAWNDKMQAYLGVTPPDDGKHGVLQDVHWSSGLVGYFPTYSLGNFLSVQYWDKAIEENPSIPDEIANGNFEPLHTWMADKIYRHGRKFWPAELTERICGEPIQVQSFVRYMKNKFSDIYGL